MQTLTLIWKLNKLFIGVELYSGVNRNKQQRWQITTHHHHNHKSNFHYHHNQFGRTSHKDVNAHLASFLELCDMIKFNGVSTGMIKLRLFPFSLKDRASQWLQSLPLGSIITLQDIVDQFLVKYFPPAKTAQLRLEIDTFKQLTSKTLEEAREHFKEPLRKCLQYGYQLWMQIQTFYNWTSRQLRTVQMQLQVVC